MENEVTIKTECYCIQEHSRINKVLATINAKNLAKLMDVVGLTANPRKSKKNKITTAICDTLRTSPAELRFKSKGMLISSSNCTKRERGRFTLSFEDKSYEGVLDGGHNMLAVGLFIFEEYFGEESNKKLRQINNWDSFIELWRSHREGLSEILEIFEFEMPIEIIYPTEEYKAKFPDSIFEISDARNNNFSLNAGTKAHHKGYYEILKEVLDADINENIEWKDGEGKRIKRDDIIALSLVPLLALQEAKKLTSNLPKINSVSLYSSKGKCIEIFSSFFDHYSDENGEVKNELFLSAISMLRDLPKLYDCIYKLFPDAYRCHSQRFGGISCVKIYEKGKKGPSYLSKPATTKYYKEECDAKYPDGFIIPIVAGLHSLMVVKNDKLEWKVEPYKFIEEKLNESVKMLVNTIKDNDYNPNTVGKSNGAYDSMKIMFELLSK